MVKIAVLFWYMLVGCRICLSPWLQIIKITSLWCFILAASCNFVLNTHESEIISVSICKTKNFSHISLFLIVCTKVFDRTQKKGVKTMSSTLRMFAVAVLDLAIMPGCLVAQFRFYRQRNARNDICSMPQKPGPNELSCRAYIPRYFYNSRTGKCELFIYGGCNGNANRFIICCFSYSPIM